MYKFNCPSGEDKEIRSMRQAALYVFHLQLCSDIRCPNYNICKYEKTNKHKNGKERK